MTEIEFELNGETKRVDVEPTTPLREMLREEFGLTGTKVGCLSGRCGVCTVHVDGTAVKSCLVMASKADGAAVETIEGMDEGEDLHELQEAFDEHFASQCGYCTPGFIMAAKEFAEEDRERPPSREEIRDSMKGNLCRCTGYEKIIDAIESVVTD